MKKFFSLVLAFALVLSAAGAALAENRLEAIKAAGKIVVATSPDFAPSEFLDPSKTGQEAIVGADVSLMKYIAEYLGVELVIEPMDFSATLGAVAMGAVDMAISGFSPTPDRKESMELSIPFLYEADNGQSIMMMKDKADQYKKAEDFTGLTIAVQNASLQQTLLQEQLPGAIPELVTNINDAVMMLITGKVDAVGVAVDNGWSYVENYPELAVCDFRYEYAVVGTSAAVQKGQVELIAAVNEAIQSAVDQGLLLGWYTEAKELAASLGIE